MHSSAEFKRLFAVSLPIIAMLLAAVLSAPVQGQEVDDWCDDDGWGRDREVRETTISAAAISVDAGNNGGVTVEAWDRPDVLVQAKVSSQADSGAGGERLASEVTLRTAGGDISASGTAHRQR